ncbi:MAG: N-acetylmuramoyl-L-alanine amidase [Clostridia bacterium]|nr:N-acetylmuramoyl-L-alanine amidase [Clostridia bacterium]MBQ8739861.1 N-acetylmuramoyl-L-alanine amidase [Clostridia bacterium]
MKRSTAFNYILKFTLCFSLIIGVTVLSASLLSYSIRDTSTAILEGATPTVIVIDAGHGGEDAGAVAHDGTLEKDLNLKIATLLYALCSLNGNECVMTRDDDTLLYDRYDDLENYTGKKKLYDLKNRVRIANEYENAVFVSIHMNNFSSAQYSGTQVYFSPNNAKSELLARVIQGSARTYLQPSNKRQIKRATSDIFVLSSLECVSVLVECGFLSNEGELANLKNEKYRLKLSLILFSSVIQTV